MDNSHPTETPQLTSGVSEIAFVNKRENTKLNQMISKDHKILTIASQQLQKPLPGKSPPKDQTFTTKK
jgi:hypothetical protein